ncbi:hypothetical protein OG439_27380 [Amycolatopsis sp. NBC_01307]|uniref:hypothetical protein n=1 Tax=Amycolatopsis sp. NBC_01307 TaxID=2903561 RepID=UPI002E146022|nr:hypothetical protein OG439_27380 [Amycolatopsis sp. NBC_01307]
MNRHCATRRLHRLNGASVVRLSWMHPYMLRHTFVTNMLDVGVDLRDVQIAAHHAAHERPCITNAPARTSTGTRTPSPRRTSRPRPDARRTVLPSCEHRMLSASHPGNDAILRVADLFGYLRRRTPLLNH